MKKLLLMLSILTGILLSSPARADVGVSFGIFYSSLESHGEWINFSAGYAWRPVGVGPDWRPYTEGHWMWTDDGWYWASDEPWSWAVYHYGRWYYDDYYGWLWLPGYDWAPAWVEWRYGADYVGWAPLGPYAIYQPGWGITYRTRWVTPIGYWAFVDCRYIGHPSMHRYLYRSYDNDRFIGRTRDAGTVRFDDGRIVTRGPDRTYVERRGNIRVPRGDIIDVHSSGAAGIRRDGGREQISVYRPHIEARPDDRPGRVRESERPIRLDNNALDVRARGPVREVPRTPPNTTDQRRPDAPVIQSTPGRGRDYERPPVMSRPEVRTQEQQRSPRYEAPRARTPEQSPRIEAPRSRTPQQSPRYEAPRSRAPQQSPRIEAPRSRAPERSARPAERPSTRESGGRDRRGR